ncbi:MAG: hypothetical protein JWN98_756 [Abditibacteriota bacterium]|nr:hypothetical protein [Abditibacteriota bacterium]
MTTDSWFQLVLRALPAVIVLALGFVAASDARSRERWAQLLYQAGSIRPAQRDDLAVQRGVRLPFFLVGTLLLIWPILFYIHSTRTINITQQSDLYKRASPALGQSNTAPAAVPGTASVPGTTVPGTTVPGTASVPGTLVAPDVGTAPQNAVPQVTAPATAEPTGPHL